LTLTAQLLDGSQKPEIQLQISDNGPGLPQESLRVLFDPFVVRSDTPAEYGIHLMACYFIVYHHGGKIEAKSQQGQGTTFTLHLPVHPDRAAPAEGDHDFLQKILVNESLWNKLISSE
jgi:two-component system, probable response regulator PhcQ